jgi:hypothetical protein
MDKRALVPSARAAVDVFVKLFGIGDGLTDEEQIALLMAGLHHMVDDLGGDWAAYITAAQANYDPAGTGQYLNKEIAERARHQIGSSLALMARTAEK